MSNDELMKRLHENGSTGLDLSPGDDVAAAAEHRINELENEQRSLVIDIESHKIKAASLESRLVQAQALCSTGVPT